MHSHRTDKTPICDRSGEWGATIVRFPLRFRSAAGHSGRSPVTRLRRWSCATWDRRCYSRRHAACHPPRRFNLFATDRALAIAGTRPVILPADTAMPVKDREVVLRAMHRSRRTLLPARRAGLQTIFNDAFEIALKESAAGLIVPTGTTARAICGGAPG